MSIENQTCINEAAMCAAPIHKRGLCLQHYTYYAEQVGRECYTWKQLEALGFALPEEKPAFQCKYPGCAAAWHYAKGYCATHYQWFRYHQRKDEPLLALCEESGCDRKQNVINDGKPRLLDGKAYCPRHFNEYWQAQRQK